MFMEIVILMLLVMFVLTPVAIGMYIVIKFVVEFVKALRIRMKH